MNRVLYRSALFSNVTVGNAPLRDGTGWSTVLCTDVYTALLITETHLLHIAAFWSHRTGSRGRGGMGQSYLRQADFVSEYMRGVFVPAHGRNVDVQYSAYFYS